MDQIAKTYINNKIKSLISDNYYKNIEELYNKNNSFEQFITNHCKSSTIVAHFNLTLSDNEYKTILYEIKKELNSQNINFTNNVELVHNFDTENIKKKIKINMNAINGFVDAMILAFITGAFLGIIFLNLYSKIVSNI